MTIIAGSDIETTGLDPKDHRIIEVYTGLYSLSSRRQVGSYFKRINPHRSIAAEAQRVHKISIEDLQHEPAWDAVAPNYRASLEGADLTVWHNGDAFDLPFVNSELKRVELAPLTKPTFDTMVNGRWATGIGNVPSLSALCFACGVPYDDTKAHAAEYDVDRMMQCFFKGLDWGWFQLPTALAAAA
jgi:DNA polymerase-3 subunit epsilon